MRSILPSPPPAGARWREVFDAAGEPRPVFSKLLSDLQELGPRGLRLLEDRMEATQREMGVTFDGARSGGGRGREPWTCDLLPQVFTAEEWSRIVRGFRQRLQAFEMFLADVHGKKEILREGAVPIHAVLGSAHYHHAAAGLPRPRDAFLHLAGMCIARDESGALRVKHHHFAHAAGISCMLQNRRALARVAPELFADAPVQSLAEVPLRIMEQLREVAPPRDGEPAAVLLSPGAGAASSELAFLARRMGIPMVQGDDLLVLDDRVYLKTVRGLERIDVICNRVPDALIDPLVFRKDSRLGVPGLVHCVRRGTVALINPVGSQLADDHSLLAFAPQIVRFYLGEAPVLPNVTTYWLGDIDQRELVLGDLDAFAVRSVWRERTVSCWDESASQGENAAALLAQVRQQPARFIAQPRREGVPTLCWTDGRATEHPQDHLVYAVRAGEEFNVLPGALTRVYPGAHHGGSGRISKDTWVLSGSAAPVRTTVHRPPGERAMPMRPVTSRVADAFYWMGRYLERTHHLASLISIVETLETEELTSAERRHYRPMWNRLLPPLDSGGSGRRRSIADRLDRYRLVFAAEPGSVRRTFQRAMSNAEAVLDSISPEAWGTINELRTRFDRARLRRQPSEDDAARITRRMSEYATQLIPQFFAVCADTMLADDGWRFCEVGRMFERAVITANSVVSVSENLAQATDASPEKAHASELQLSAFLRLLSSRDAYRRIYQMRAEAAAVLELLWQHPQVPRSVVHCLETCEKLLRNCVDTASADDASAPAAIEALVHRVRRINWSAYFHPAVADEDAPAVPAPSQAGAGDRSALKLLLRDLLGSLLEVHTLVADSFLNHQARIARVVQPRLKGI